ncbi:conserved Plasmodium protein, unknown function [Plasmodium sp. gorilla clade G3]|nr:conserved Plasmodium protein, unknown function [Plasmodium sp. gorilla clade G3]
MMYDHSRQINATLKKCSEMDDMCHLYNMELMQQRERIENLKRKLHSYNKNIEEQESIFKNVIKYTDGFINNIITFLERFSNSKELNLLSNCAKYCLADDMDELNLINNFNKMNSINSHKKKEIKTTKLVNSKYKNDNSNKISIYSDENKVNKKIPKKKKTKNKYKNDVKKKYLEINENIYNLHNPYDTVEIRDLYNIYRNKSTTLYENTYIN